MQKNPLISLAQAQSVTHFFRTPFRSVPQRDDLALGRGKRGDRPFQVRAGFL